MTCLETLLMLACVEPASKTTAMSEAKKRAAWEGWSEAQWLWDVAWDTITRDGRLQPVGRRWKVREEAP